MGQWWWLEGTTWRKSRAERKAASRLALTTAAVCLTLMIVGHSALRDPLRGHDVIQWLLMFMATLAGVLTARPICTTLWPDEIWAGDEKAQERRDNPLWYDHDIRNERAAMAASFRSESEAVNSKVEVTPTSGGVNDSKIEGTTPTEKFLFASFLLLAISLGSIAIFGWRLWCDVPNYDLAEPFRQRSNNFLLFANFTLDVAFNVSLTLVGVFFLGTLIRGMASFLITGRLPAKNGSGR